MKKGFNLRSMAVLALVICFVALIGSATLGAKLYTMGTSSSGGSVYQVGAGIANLLNGKVSGLNIRAMSTGGAVDNVGMMSRDEADFAMNASNVNYLAYNGKLQGMKEQKNIRGIASIYPSVFHFVALKSKNLNTIADLKGTKGSVGASASATDVYTQHVLGYAGIDYKTRKDITAVYSDSSSASDLLKDGHIDWAHFPLGVPGSTVLDLALTAKINIIQIEGAFRDGLLKEYPFYIPYTIPGGTYNGFPNPIETVGCVITFVCDEKVPSDLVYQITKALWENIDDAKKINKAMSWMSTKNAFSGIGVPLHPGAEKYYKEIGIIK
ncbi:MAG: NMT1/THI5 like protein [Firmicutes bacterium ADurb.Bin153]|nr:MAG: NMT1/THI5 like protein [Firmicutes bacterium ADurb.Bin153]HPU95730.1 TAXI family TRAP transporter solute-binding subunit [Bacillota bacterium]